MMGFVEYINRPAPFVVVDDILQSLLTALYGNGEQGAFFVPKPQVLGQQVLFQDAAGTTPVTAPGDPVGLMLDLSGNDNHAAQEVSGARPVYRTDGTRHWLEFDGVDDQLESTYANTTVDILVIAAARALSSSAAVIYGSSDSQPRNYVASEPDPYIGVGSLRSDSTVTVGLGNDFVVGFVNNDDGLEGWVNGQVLVSQQKNSPRTGRTYKVGNSGGSFYFSGRVYGAIAKDTARTADYRIAERYLANLAGVTLDD